MFQLWIKSQRIKLFLLILTAISLIIATDASASGTGCILHSDCQTESEKSGVCWKGKCRCHPSFYPPNCQTAAGFNESFGRIRFEVTKQKLGGDEAALICQKKLGYLATIENVDQTKHLMSQIEKKKDETNGFVMDLYYIGLKFNQNDKVWRWRDGSPLSYHPSSWNNAENEAKIKNPSPNDYVAMDQFGKWQIVDASAKLAGSICQFSGMDEYRVETAVLSYSDAEKYCRDDGLDVVSFYRWQEYEYTNALYRVNGVMAGWVGLHFTEESIGVTKGWKWSDGTSYNETFMTRIPFKDTYNEFSRVEMLPFKNEFTAVNADLDGRAARKSVQGFGKRSAGFNKNKFICRTAPYKRDCGVLLKLDPTLPSGDYMIRPKYNNLYGYCDMGTDGGGYTYYITHGNYQLNDNIAYNVYNLQSIKDMCADFSPLHITSPSQVIELKRVLEDLGYDLDGGVLPIARYENERYYSLGDNSDITRILTSLEADYNITVQPNKAGVLRKPVMVGIGLGNTLTRFYIKDRSFKIVGVICSTNNKAAPADSFTVNYRSYGQHSTNVIQHNIVRDTILSNLTVCTWFRYTDQGEGVVFSLKDATQEVLALLIAPYNDRFVVKGRTFAASDFGIHDRQYHRVCLVLRKPPFALYLSPRIYVDDREITYLEIPILDFDSINLAGTLTLGDREVISNSNYLFLGDIDSFDIWDRVLSQEELGITTQPLYMPGNIVRWRDFNKPVEAPEVIKAPSNIYGYSKFKVGIGPSSLRWAKNYCFARGGELGAPRNDYEYTQILRILQGHKGWVALRREDNTLFERDTSHKVTLTYVPSAGADGDVAIDEYGDFITLDSTVRISFVCQYNVSEEIPRTQECSPEEMSTKRGRFSWVRATINSTVKVLCPFGTVDPRFTAQGYASRSCQPATNSTAGEWSAADTSKCNYANKRTQLIDNLAKTTVTADNAAEIASAVRDLTQNTAELDDTGLSLITGIIEDLVNVKSVNATTDIANTLSNVLDVDEAVLESAQAGDHTADRIISSLQAVAGSIASNDSEQQTLVTKNIEISAVRVSNESDTRLQSQGIAITLPESATVNKTDTAAYLITYKSNKLFMTNVTSRTAALDAHTNKTLESLPFLNTPIISAGVEDSVIRDLPTPVNITLPVYSKGAGRPRCVYYVPGTAADSAGSWQSDGVTAVYSDNYTVTCVSDHMTSFAVIMTIDPVTTVTEGVHDMWMTTITYICLFVSLFGLVLTIFALTFQKTLWRLDMTKVHVCLSISLLFGYVIFLVGIDQVQSRALCISVAVLLHITFLIAFMWMAVEAYTLYLQFVKVFPSYTPNFLPKCCVVVFSLPLCIAGSFLVAGLSLNITDFYEVESFCWIRGYTLYFGFITPILLIIVANILIFAYVTRNICRIVTLNKDDKKMSQFSIQLRAASSVLVVLGVPWIIGAFTFGKGSIWFQYAFIILNGLQGFCIFVFHVLLKPEVRKRWYNSIQGYTTSISTNSHGFKSASYHRAQKYEVQQLNKNEEVKLRNKDNNDSKAPFVNDTRFTYLSNSNDYATIESRPMSVSSAASDHSVSMTAPNSATPLIRSHPPTPRQTSPSPTDTDPLKPRPLSAETEVTKRPLSTVASMEPPSSAVSTESSQNFAFSPISHPDSWQYNPLTGDQV